MKITKIGVAPGTTTMQLGARQSTYDQCCEPYKPCCDELVYLQGLGASTAPPPPPRLPFPERSQWYPIDPLLKWEGRLPLGQAEILPIATLPARARIRWDVIGIIGGGSLMIALAIGLIASAIGKR